ncbi:MAG: 5-(carboxyamino)imidazole ribonucleotide mutase [Clostridiales bacterium]
MKKIAVILGSLSDLPVVEPAIKLLQQYQVPYEAHILSAHRTPAATAKFAAEAAAADFGVIIAAAGKAAHLAGAIAAQTTLPVIGIPVKSSTLDGLDALLATVQMPSGVPVATVAIDGAYNAAILAIQILAISEPRLAELLRQQKTDMAVQVAANDLKLLQQLREVE